MPVDLENLGRWKERKESEKRLCLHMWQAAWDGYAIAAVALEQALLLLVALALQIGFFLLSAPVPICRRVASQEERG